MIERGDNSSFSTSLDEPDDGPNLRFHGPFGEVALDMIAFGFSECHVGDGLLLWRSVVQFHVLNIGQDEKDACIRILCQSFTGQAYAVDRKNGVVQRLDPSGMAGATSIPSFLRELAYLPEADWLVVVGSTLPANSSGIRPTPAYDCAANQWVALTVAGPSPAGKDGRNVSAGAAYDAKRGLIWATDTNGQIYVLRLDASSVAREDL